MSAVPALDPRDPITRERFYALVDSGAFDDRRVELVDGRIVEKEPMGPQHGRAIRRIAALHTTSRTTPPAPAGPASGPRSTR